MGSLYPVKFTPANCCVYILKFCKCEHDISYVLGINSNGRFKQGYVESSLPPQQLSYFYHRNAYGHTCPQEQQIFLKKFWPVGPKATLSTRKRKKQWQCV